MGIRHFELTFKRGASEAWWLSRNPAFVANIIQFACLLTRMFKTDARELSHAFLELEFELAIEELAVVIRVGHLPAFSKFLE